MATVSFTHVWKIYDRRVQAVKDLCLTVEDGQFLAFLGPSGCGKTTSLRMVAGLEKITSGEVRIGDVVVNDLRPRERDIAMVFETYGLYPHLSVYDNIAFPLRVRNLSSAEVDQRVKRASSILDLNDTLKHFPSELGDGQKQRVSIGRAIVREPEVFLFDEPISHLDETLRHRMRKEIKHLQKTLATTMIYVTHDQIEAMAMADQVVVMDQGIVQQLGEPTEIFDNPANTFVAAFIGEPPMNMLRGQVICEDDRLSFRVNGLRVPINNPTHALALNHRNRPEIVLGVRPTDISASFEPGTESVEACTYGLEPHGDYNVVSIRVGEEVMFVCADSSFFPNFGDRINLSFGQTIHLFDPDTGRNILCN